jgi:hypothetical protein
VVSAALALGSGSPKAAGMAKIVAIAMHAQKMKSKIEGKQKQSLSQAKEDKLSRQK